MLLRLDAGQGEDAGADDDADAEADEVPCAEVAAQVPDSAAGVLAAGVLADVLDGLGSEEVDDGER